MIRAHIVQIQSILWVDLLIDRAAADRLTKILPEQGNRGPMVENVHTRGRGPIGENIHTQSNIVTGNVRENRI